MYVCPGSRSGTEQLDEWASSLPNPALYNAEQRPIGVWTGLVR